MNLHSLGSPNGRHGNSTQCAVVIEIVIVCDDLAAMIMNWGNREATGSIYYVGN
ncbi:MAG: hypothetical protein ACI8XX_001547 [Polaribacter sp.]|jgi:hypothetical protein